jgi:hypothetical protein
MFATQIVWSILCGLLGPDSSQPSALAADKPSIVLITIDALRADRLGAYGYERPTSPNLDALARQSVLFERAYAPTPSTSFSIASLLIGNPAYAITRETDLDGFETMADWLAKAGYETAALYPPAVYFSATSAFDGVRARHFGFGRIVHDALAEDRDAVERTDESIRILRELWDKPVFLWAHYFAPHEPYTRHPDVAVYGDSTSSESQRYDGEVKWVDREIGRLIDYLHAERPSTVIVVTSDHGEEFGEHGGAYHGTSLFEEQIRVPLLVQAPWLAPRRDKEPISTVGVRRIVEGVLAKPPHPHSIADGRAPVFAELGSLKAVVVGQHKAVCDLWNGRCRLFDLAKDPHEQRNLAARQPRRLGQLRNLINAWVAANPAVAPSSLARNPIQDALRRARRSDRRSAPTLLSIVRNRRVDVDTKTEAARLLSDIVVREHRRSLRTLWKADESPLNRWLAIGLARVGDRQAKKWLRRIVPGGRPDDAEFGAQRAVVLAQSSDPLATPRLAEALLRAEGDGVRCQIFGSLGQVGGKTARDVLVSSYADLRTRYCVASALVRLRDPATAAFLSDKIRTEPYANVRAVLVHALGRAGGSDYRSHLEEIQVRDGEPIVSAAAALALGAMERRRL